MSTGTFLPVLNEVEKASIRERQPLPERYLGLSDEEMERRIAAARATLGRPARHPRPPLPARRSDPVRRLHRRLVQARRARSPSTRTPSSSSSAACTSWPRAPTCSALPHQKVILPDLAAGCSMADMAPADELEICWSELEQLGVASRTVPVTYINSAAAIKSFVGERGGTVCTSSNAAAVLEVGLAAAREDPVPARPAPGPQHRLLRMGVPLDQMVVWDPHRAVRRADARAGGGGAPHPVEGPLLGARALHRAADCGGAQPHIRACA